MAVAGALAALARFQRGRLGERRDWLPEALRALSQARDARLIATALSHHLEHGVATTHVEWWHRDDDGIYRSRLGRVAGPDAEALDRWAVSGHVWQPHEPAAADTATTHALAATGAALAVPLSLDGRPVGLLALGARRDQRPYGVRDVAAVTALAGHVALVAERTRMAAMLDESRRMLQQATRLSTVGTIAAELAHEIRNPLVAVQTFLQILPERLDDPEVTGDLRAVALTELQRVARLLNELLGMARASVATFAATDLETLVEQVVRFLQVSAHKKDVVLERVGDRLPNGAADASRLKQALVNLVLNAIQASPAGKQVTVATLTGRDAADQPFVEIAVQDEGAGIPEEQRETIFHPFFTTKDTGTGLGLPVTRQIVADHGGSITVGGAPGRGATFVIRLPLATAERRDQAA